MSTRWISPNGWWLVVPPVVMCALDFVLTMHGQSAEYWAGNYAKVNEWSPSFCYYLTLHPVVFVAAGLLWIALFSAIILVAPERLAMTTSVAIVIGHMWGATTWLAHALKSYQACMGLFILVAAMIVVSFKRGQSADGRAAFDWQRTGLPGWVRWVV